LEKKYIISDKTINETTHCEKGFSCLTKDGYDLCSVDNCVLDTIYFIKCMCDNPCSYKDRFGFGHFCTCPVRKELHDKYRI
jgi:hypothetical protein